jgi:hypothetical protein
MFFLQYQGRTGAFCAGLSAFGPCAAAEKTAGGWRLAVLSNALPASCSCALRISEPGIRERRVHRKTETRAWQTGDWSPNLA